MGKERQETVRVTGFLPSLRILSYHSISNLAGSALENYGVPPDQFERQIDTLAKNGYTFFNPAHLVETIAGRSPIDLDSLLITFDDCYKDFSSCALPILRRYGIKAMVFPISRLIGADNVWDNRLGATNLQLLDADELRQIQSEGVAIGLHSRTHPRLTDLSDSELVEEIEGSSTDLTALGLNPLPVLAYPYGVFNERVKTIARNCGIQAALTTVPGIVQAKGDSLQIPRIEVFPGESGNEFLEKVAHLRVANKMVRPGSRGPESRDRQRAASDVTLVILSCGRYDLLDATVRSFFRINKYPIREVLISEDSGDPAGLLIE